MKKWEYNPLKFSKKTPIDGNFPAVNGNTAIRVYQKKGIVYQIHDCMEADGGVDSMYVCAERLDYLIFSPYW